MKVTADIEKRYKLTVDNKDCCMGQYYAEDDWSISVYGKSYPELALKLKNHWRFEELTYNGGDLEEISVLIYDDRIFDLEDTGRIKYPESSKLAREIYNMTTGTEAELKQKIRELKLERIVNEKVN